MVPSKIELEYEDKYERLIKEFAEVINRNSLENGSDTPDYILGRYLVECLCNYNDTIQLRNKWSEKKLFDPAVNDSIKDMEEEEKAFPPDKE